MKRSIAIAFMMVAAFIAHVTAGTLEESKEYKKDISRKTFDLILSEIV